MPKKPSTADFIHLHVHSHYSLLNAVPTPKELAAKAKEDGQDALALTDNGALYGAIDFYKACMKEEIKPIIGLDAFLSPRSRHDKSSQIDKPRTRLVLLAKTFTGYQNLIQLVTLANLEGFYYRPRIDEELLEKYHEDLVCIIPSFSGEVVKSLKDGDEEAAKKHLDFYKKTFKDDCYLEITHHPEILDHQKYQSEIRKLAKETNTPLVAAHDVYYLKPEDRIAREVMNKIQSGGVVDISAELDSEEDFSFITQKQALEYFKDDKEALENTVKIANSCFVELEIGTHWYFPDYKIENDRDPDEVLKERSYKGLEWREMSLENSEIKTRLDYELEVIKNKGYAKYFLVVGDLLREAREREIFTTIRGSVAGSLTTYVLGITNVDPLEYKLPFERFLNPERPSAPDIDMDYADNRRDEIIEYAKEKYGSDKVAQIGTFGTMMAKAAVRDVARALGHPYSVGDRISKLIPVGSQGFPMTLKKALEIEPDLADLYKKDSEAKEVINLAKQIEGRVRHLGVHAAGVVIAPAPLNQFVPIQIDPKTGKYITQYEMKSVGEDGVGLLKFDFLGIKNLSILADAVKRVRAIQDIIVKIEDIPVDDEKTFKMLARGETMSLFQLNGTGMTVFLKQLQPTTIHDINAMVALYRPGPMESIPQYIERKNNPSLVSYLDKRLEPILERSYGVITYQDDVMTIARELAGYSWLEADMLRKAMGKKIPAVMAAEKDKLLTGFVDYGKLSASTANKLWSLIEPFAAYGFNKAHAASYGRVAYQTAFMKANYPLEYMSAVLTADSGDTERISEDIKECKRMGIEVLPPDINESFSDFTVVRGKNTIRFGLTTIKNFGEGVAKSIIAERKKSGVFTSISNFLERVQDRTLTKKSLEALITTGAMDSFGERGEMLVNVEAMLTFNRERIAEKESSQESLFNIMGGSVNSSFKLTRAPEADIFQKLTWEKELLGVYVSGHPLNQYQTSLEKRPSIQTIKQDGKNGAPVVTAGMINNTKELLTKKGDRMAFITLENIEDQIELVVFPRTYTELKEILTVGNCIAIKGRLTIRNDEPSIALERAKLLENNKV